MNLTDVDDLELFSGKPLMVKDVCLVYHPTLLDIAKIGQPNFYNYISLLTADKTELLENAQDMSEIIYLIATSLISEEFFDLIKQAFRFFIKEEIIILPELQMIRIGDSEDRRFLDNDSFVILQEYIRKICMLNEKKIEEFDGNEHVKRIKEKIRKGQALVAKIKAKEGRDENNPQLVDLISSFLARATEVDIHTIWDMPYYMFQIQFRRMQMIEEYETNLKASLAGAKIPKEQMKHWIRKIQEK